MEKQEYIASPILEAIANNEPKVLEQLYNEYRKPFIVWSIQSYQCSEEDAIEIYQKAFTVMYMNVRNGKLTVLTSSLKTYLFSIGKNLFREKFRDKHTQYMPLDTQTNHEFLSEHIDTSIFDKYQASHQKEIVRGLLERIGDPCRKLLNLIFIQGIPQKDVVDTMGYSDDRVVRKRKSLCLKQLRQMVSDEKDKYIN